jgi:hypothetical protein
MDYSCFLKRTTPIVTKSYVKSKTKLQTIKKVTKNEKGLKNLPTPTFKLLAITLSVLGQNYLLLTSL